MNLEKRVSLSISILLLFVIISCKGQNFEKTDIRLLIESNKRVEVNESTKKVVIDKNISQNIIKESNDSKELVENLEKNNSTIETNQSILIPIAKDDTKSNKVQLAKLLKEKEVELAKLESDKEIAKTKELNRKELSLLELESKEKMALAKLDSQKNLSKEQKELDKIKSLNNKEIALAKIQSQKDISKNEEKIALSKTVSDKEIAIAKLKNERELADKNIAFYKMIAMMVVGLIVLALLIIYFINSRKRKNELKMHQDELHHKEYMEASRQHNEHIGKMLDVIIDENADKGVKKEIVRLLKDQGKKGNLIEHKR